MRLFKVRAPLFIIFMQLGGVITFVVYCIIEVFGRTPQVCLLLNFWLPFFIPVWALPYIFQIVSVVFESNRNHLKSKLMGKSSLDIRENWIWSTAKWISPKMKIIYLIVYTICQVTVTAIVWATVPLEPEEDCMRPALYVFSGFGIGVMVFLTYFFHKVIHLRDPFYLKYELLLNNLVNGPLLVVAVVYTFAPSVFPKDFEIFLLFLIAIFVNVWINMVFPILLSFPFFVRFIQRGSNTQVLEVADFELEQLSGPDSVVSKIQNKNDKLMNCILENQNLLDQFVKFAQKNWCSENILFYLQAIKFRIDFENNSDDELRAQQIVQNFIARYSPLEINIDSLTRNQIIFNVKSGKVSQDTFISAEDHVYRVMRDDTLFLWQATPSFHDSLVKTIEKNNKGKTTLTGYTIRRMPDSFESS